MQVLFTSGYVHTTPFSLRSVFAPKNGAVFLRCSHYSVFRQKLISIDGAHICPKNTSV